MAVAEERPPARLKELDGRPAWRTRGGFKPRGRQRIQLATAEKWIRDGYAERRVLAGHDALVLTRHAEDLLKARPDPDAPAPTRWWDDR